MIELKHTTRDLEVIEHLQTGIMNFNEYDVMSDNYIVATFWDGVHGEINAKANAMLYAASSDMLKALIESDITICELCKRLNPQHKNCISCQDREKRIKLIERATGMKIGEVLKDE